VKITFLSAAVPLSKSYEEIAPGNYREESYPHVAKFSSLEYDVTDICQFHDYMVAASEQGMCLLKGNLDRPLVDESRAGHTNSSDPTMWVCLDVDYTVPHAIQPAQWLDNLHPCFKDVSFIFHYSAGQNIKTHDGWRGHFFILLDEEVTPAALKQWLIHLNITHDELRSNLALCASGAALRYPLDITTCQNDKLIFIAPPTTIGFEVKGDRFESHNRTREHLTLDLSGVSAAVCAKVITDIVKEKRQEAELPAKKFKTKSINNGCDVLTNPDPVTVTGKKEARGFVYLNLDGGDSWAYYFPIDNPEVLYNFKGEPAMYLRDVDKDIYLEYKPKSSQSPAVGKTPFGVLDTNTNQYYRGFANSETSELLEIRTTPNTRVLRDFLTQNGVFLPRSEKDWNVEEWDVHFDPTKENVVNWAEQTINTYKKTQYIANAEKTPGTTVPPTIDKVLTSICVQRSVKDRFLNWLAYIFQTRQKTGTAWIFQGTQGTGKGVLYEYILSPILGHDYCHEMTMDRMNDDFNQYLEQNLLLFIDEAQTGDSKSGERILNRIKNLVTEPRQHIRGMRRNAVTRDNYTNIVLASNHDEIIRLDTADRRFNVAPRQETPISLDYDDILCIRAELPGFATFLNSYAVSERDVRQVLMNEDRQKLVDLSQTTLDKFFLAIRHGDLAYFTQFLTTSITTDVEGLKYHDFARIVLAWVSGSNEPMNVARDDLRIVYQFLQQSKVSPTKFSRMAGKYNLEIVPVRINNDLVRGLLSHQWHLDQAEKAALVRTYRGKGLELVKDEE
jgi:hypothetical protein